MADYPLRIMFYINTLQRGGAERVISTLASELAKRGHECLLVTSYGSESGEYPCDSRVKRINLEQRNESAAFISRNVRRVVRLRHCCKVEKPSVLVSFMQQPILRALAATVRLPVCNVISVRNDPAIYWQNPVMRLAAAVLVPRASFCVLQTNDARNAFAERFSGVRSTVVLNPVGESFFDIVRDDGDSLVVSCGRLVEQKNHALLIRSFARTSKKHPCWRLAIYGDGPLRDRLANLISELGLDERVALCGRADNVEQVLSRASVFVLPSDFEGLPNALMEAMAAGVPCVATDCPCGGPRSLIRDGEDGLLVGVGDEVAMSEAVDTILADSDFRQRVGVNAKQCAEAFATAKVVDEWETLLFEVTRREA